MHNEGESQHAVNPDTIEALSQAVYPSFAMLAAMQLDLFSSLAVEPMASADLARALGVDGVKLEVLLYALVVTGLLREEGGRFSNSAEADRYLVRGTTDFMGDRHLLWSDIWQSVMRTADSVRTGQAQARHDFNTMTRPELDAFFGGLHPNAVSAGRDFARTRDLSDCGSLLDVGGGSGGFAIGLTEEYAHLRVTVVDLESVTQITHRYVEAAPTGDRISVVASNVAEDGVPGRYDAAILKNFIQVLSPKQSLSALEHVFEAVNPGGTIYITGHILEDSRLSPAESVVFNIVFINVYDSGKAYTRSEYSDWLARAGFVDVVFEAGDLIVARRPDRNPESKGLG